jgi:homopolymeric O-antigen transport system ATP-binding protein
MAPVISVENLSKRYIIGHQKQERYTALRDVLANGARSLANRLCHPFASPQNDPTHEEFWALKDVSFDIQQGDRVGIIGRNGAGKSTLLKILSRITEPTAGRVKIKGRVASLLEVGTGFHPELTGRENIFLNGAILGMSKAEIKSKFDEIVAFAEVERFLDTPVKRYSSGMYVRLAFAVAAHLEPEILIVDEVLAVGDAQFQKKCLGKMEEVGQEGRTVLFVSHNMGALRSLCDRAVLLRDGSLAAEGETETIISEYVKNFQHGVSSEVCFEFPDDAFDVRPLRLKIFGKDDRETAQFRIGEVWKFRLEFEVSTKINSVVAAIGIETVEGIPVVVCPSRPQSLNGGVYQVEFEIAQTFSVNDFFISIGISSLGQAIFYREKCAIVSVSAGVSGKEQYMHTHTNALLLSPMEAEIEVIHA